MPDPGIITATQLLESDAELQKDGDVKKDHEKFTAMPSNQSIEATVKALREKKHTVHVVETEAAALDVIKTIIKDGMSISSGHSTTLEQIGFVDWIPSIEHKITNFKAKSIAAVSSGDRAAGAEYMTKGATSDLWISSCAAISEDGGLYAGDYSGTRISGWIPAKQLLVVAGVTKIVKNEAMAWDRLYRYQLKLESARSRVAYKVPGSAVNNVVAIKGSNAMAEPRVIVLLIKKAGLGF